MPESLLEKSDVVVNDTELLKIYLHFSRRAAHSASRSSLFWCLSSS
jgi:hypothetical protein